MRRHPMSDTASGRADPDRLRLMRSTIELRPLPEVAEAVSVATQDERRVYVERIVDRYRWSLTHPGSGYPMLRIAARFLKVDYHRIMVPFRRVADGVFVLCEDPGGSHLVPEAWAVLDFDGPTPADAVGRRIAERLGGHT
jgi:hypothetical protein